jgi:drug/metabolite transporter (DMT)-like permease
MSAALVKPNHKIGILLSILTCIVCGIFPAATKAAYAEGANVVFVLWFTVFMRALMMSSFVVWKRRALMADKTYRRETLLAGFWQAISVACVLGGVAFIPGPVVMTILFSYTLMLLFFMAFRGEIKLDSVTLLTTLLALLGLTMVMDIWHVQSVNNLTGFALAFMAAIATVCRLYLFGKQTEKRNPAVVGAEVFIVAFLFLLLLGFWKLPIVPQTLAGWGWSSLAALSLGSGSFGMFYGVALLGSFKWSLFAKVEPIFTALFSIWFLGETLKTSQYVGMAVVIGSLIAYQLLTHRKKKA